MKNLVLMVCAVIALFAFSSCEKCLECTKIKPECGNCNNSISGKTYDSCNDGDGSAFQQAQANCIADGGTWKVVSTATTDEQKVCGNSSSAAEDKAKPFQLDGYTCN